MLAVKTFFVFFMNAMVRAVVPRYRYDQLMRLGWKVFLPTSLVAVALVAGWRVYGRARMSRARSQPPSARSCCSASRPARPAAPTSPARPTTTRCSRATADCAAKGGKLVLKPERRRPVHRRTTTCKED